MRRAAAVVAVACLPGLAPSAAAEVTDVSAGGFATQHEGTTSATPEQVWALLRKPARWWSKDHSFSGNAANLSLEARPGGCFCETLPGGGGVVHARVVHLKPRSLLRLSGALGPLQEQAVTGTLSIAVDALPDGGTRLVFTYVVGGHARMPLSALAESVDRVIGEQHRRLIAAASGS